MKNSRVLAACLSVFLLSTTGSQSTDDGMNQALTLLETTGSSSLTELYLNPTVKEMLTELPDDKRLATAQFFLNNFPPAWCLAVRVLPIFKKIDPAEADAYLTEAKQLQATYVTEGMTQGENLLVQWFDTVTSSSPDQFSIVRDDLVSLSQSYDTVAMPALFLYEPLATARREGLASLVPVVQAYKAFLASRQGQTMNRATLEAQLRAVTELTSLDYYEHKLRNSLGWIFKQPDITKEKQTVQPFELKALLEYRRQNSGEITMDENAIFEISKIFLRNTSNPAPCLGHR